MPFPRRDPNFEQVCAIARRAIAADLTIDDAEWKARTKALLAQQGYAEPARDMLPRALSAVEKVLTQERGPRPTPMSPTPPAVRPQQDDPPRHYPRHLLDRMVSLSSLVQELQNNPDGPLSSPSCPVWDARHRDNRTPEQVHRWRLRPRRIYLVTARRMVSYEQTDRGWRRVRESANEV